MIVDWETVTSRIISDFQAGFNETIRQTLNLSLRILLFGRNNNFILKPALVKSFGHRSGGLLSKFFNFESSVLVASSNS